MRKIIVLSMVSLDGVMQAPGGPREDPSGGFRYGGWVAPYLDGLGLKVLRKQLRRTDYLLGRKTFQIWEPYWPLHGDFWPGINEGMKYVLSRKVKKTGWRNTVFLRSPADIRKLKKTRGPDLQVHGSGQLVQWLLANGLVDELWLKTYPLVLGKGKKLFDNGAVPAAFKLVESTVTPSGVVMANYRRAGKVKQARVVV